MTELLNLYQTAAFIRVFEERIAEAADAGHCPGLVHLCLGAEVAEASICQMLDGGRDQVTGSHRSHGLVLGMGADPVAVAAEIFGRGAGLSRGRGGTQHLIAPEAGFLCSTGIVGAQVPIALGAALTAKTLGTGGVGVSFFGDGAANQGAVLEAMNMAVALKLPVVFVLENNGVGQTTTSQYSSGGADLGARAEGFGLSVFKMDGFDAENCLSVAARAVALARTNTPVFIEAAVPRLGGHYHAKGSALVGEAAEDPLAALKALIPDADAARIEVQVAEDVLKAIKAALESAEAAA